MKRKITITINSAEEDVNLQITPTGLNTVLITTDSPKVVVSSEQLKAALDEAEAYRKEFAKKELEEDPPTIKTSEDLTFNVECE